VYHRQTRALLESTLSLSSYFLLYFPLFSLFIPPYFILPPPVGPECRLVLSGAYTLSLCISIHIRLDLQFKSTGLLYLYMENQSLNATLLQVMHYDPLSHWGLMQVKTEDDFVRVTGKLANPIAGERLVLDGHFTPHHPFARVFEFSQALVKPPEGEEAQINYLSRTTSAPVQLAKSLLQHFGESVLEILDSEPHRLCEVDGITADYAQALALRWRAEKSADRLSQVLLDFGLDPSLITQLRKSIGDGPNAADTLRENPYLLFLSFPEHVSIKKVRKLAQQFGVSNKHDGHIQSTLLHLLHHNAKFGHSVLSKEKLAHDANPQLAMNITAEHPEFIKALNHLQTEGHIVFHDPTVALVRLYHAENEIASDLKRLEFHEQDWDNGIDVSRLKKLLTKPFRHTPIDKLATCLQQAISHKVSLVTCDHEDSHFDFIASALFLMKHLHLEIKVVDLHPGYVAHYQSKLKQPVFSLEDIIKFNPIGPPQHHRENPFSADVVIVSHSESCDTVKMSELLAATPNEATIIFVAIPHRLKPQGAGQPIIDILNSKRLAHAHYDAPDHALLKINKPKQLIKLIQSSPPTTLIPLSSSNQEQYTGILSVIMSETAAALNANPFEDFSVIAVGSPNFVRDLNVQLQQDQNKNAEPLTHNPHSPAVNDVVRLIKPHYTPVYLPQGSLFKVESVDNNKTLHLKEKHGTSLTLKNIDLDTLVLGYVCPITAFPAQPVKNVVLIYEDSIAARLHQNFWNEILSIALERVFIIGPNPKEVFMHGIKREAPVRYTQLNASFKRYRNQVFIPITTTENEDDDGNK